MPAHLGAPQRHWITMQSYFLSLQTVFIYSLSGRQWMQLWVTNNLMMQPSCQDWTFFSFVLPVSWITQSVVSLLSPAMGPVDIEICHFSHGVCVCGGCVGHVGGHYYSWGSVIHSVTRCQQEVSVCTAAPFALFISQGWLMRSTRLIPPLEQQWL